MRQSAHASRNPTLRACARCMTMLLSLSSLGANATELVYTPVNPVFGGNPINGSVLLNNAQAQNNKKDPDATTSLSSQRSSLQQFNDTLQRAILSRVAASATSSIIGATGQLVPGSSFDTPDFSISVIALPSGALEVTTTDKVTGQTTSFQVNQ